MWMIGGTNGPISEPAPAFSLSRVLYRRVRARLTKPPHAVKCVVHWFQMMYSGRLSMFADGPAKHYLPVTYDVARVSCPVAIVYGGRDHLGRFPPPPRCLVRRWKP